MNDSVIVALDVDSEARALALVDRLGDDTSVYKVGLELFVAGGPKIVRGLRDRGKSVFLDLKLHDIPTTVQRAVSRASELGVAFLTVHALGGREMLCAAMAAAPPELTLLGVTVLTSFDAEAFGAVVGREVLVPSEVDRLARLVRDAGLEGAVCSPREAERVAEILGPKGAVVTPGIRLPGDDANDQRRVTTPADAIRMGATHIVVGRSVTAAADPAGAFARVIQDLESRGASVS